MFCFREFLCRETMSSEHSSASADADDASFVAAPQHDNDEATPPEGQHRVVFVFADPQLSLKLLLSFGTTLHSTL